MEGKKKFELCKSSGSEIVWRKKYYREAREREREGERMRDESVHKRRERQEMRVELEKGRKVETHWEVCLFCYGTFHSFFTL